MLGRRWVSLVFTEALEGPLFSLCHCGLWQASAPRAPPDADGLVPELDSASADQSQELTYVDIDTLLATL